MKIWEISVKRPVFMSCVLAAILVMGIFSFKKTPVELFPDVTFPIVVVQTVYPGAGPTEIESLVSKPIEEELSTLSGVKVIRSINRESVSIVVAEFNLNIDVKYAEQQVREKVATAKQKLPDTAEEPSVRKVDPSAQPIMVLSIKSTLQGGELYDLANEVVRSQIEQVDQVGRVEVQGVRKTEIHVNLDREKLTGREISVSQIAGSLKNQGQNVPAGKLDINQEKVFRTLGEFNTLDQIRDSLVFFYGNDVTTRVGDLGAVSQSLEDEKMRAYYNGEPAAFLYVYKQSGANTIAVSQGILSKINKINLDLKQTYGSDTELFVNRDMSKFVWANVFDVAESIIIGILLTIFVVFLFLGSWRSTLITGLAIPVSLIGSFSLLYLAGVSINIMSLLAFSLAVGLLIDDAIVVRENIFRHLEMGKTPIKAALEGTAEVGLAVVAVTLAILAVFGPIAFLQGVVGQFFKSFGLGVCFVMIVSLFDALSNAPMMSAYFGGGHESLKDFKPSLGSPVKSILALFEKFQTRLELGYENLLRRTVKRPGRSFFATLFVVVALAYTVKFVPKTFIPANDSGEFMVSIELKPGTPLSEMDKITKQVDQEIRKNPTVAFTSATVGDLNGTSYAANIYITLVPFEQRSVTTTEVKTEIRALLAKDFSFTQPKVKDIDFVGAGQRPFVVNIRGQNLNEIREVAQNLFSKLKTHPALIDPEITDKPGLPEFQVNIDKEKALAFGVTPTMVGAELRGQLEGIKVAKLRKEGLEYDIRIRMKEDQRDLEKNFNSLKVPNMNGRLVDVKNFAAGKSEVGFAAINRENRGRYISIEADIAPSGPGMGQAIEDINKYFSSGEIKAPDGVTYRFVGQAENFQELASSILIAGLLGIVFIYLVLASLYESTVTPITIMLVIPLAVAGGFFSLWIARSQLDLFSMIGCIMLMGLATKNSIILVDYIQQKLDEGLAIPIAIVEGCKTRLRPILMTSFALMAGMLPVAIGLNEASSQRTSLGIVVIGGVFFSTALTLIFIPAVFMYIERSRRWMIANVGSKIISQSDH